MTHSIRNPVSLSRLISLVVLLTSVNVLADTRVTPVDEAMQVDTNGCNSNVASHQPVDPYESMKRKKSAARVSNVSKTSRVSNVSKTSRISSVSKTASAPRVFTDSYERVLRPVTQSKQRPTLWLGLKNGTD